MTAFPMNANTLKTLFVKACYSVAFLPGFRSALYSRAIAPRWPFQNTEEQMQELKRRLLSVASVNGSYVEIGVAEGWTTIFMNQVMKENPSARRRMFAVDTFQGFTPDDKKAEEIRGKAKGMYDGLFCVNSQRWYDESMRRAGVPVKSFKSDAATFDYSKFGPIAFCFLDVDLYHPIRSALPRILPYMAKGGLIVVDDCQDDELWDGAKQAYFEWCCQKNEPIQVVAGKFGLIHT